MEASEPSHPEARPVTSLLDVASSPFCLFGARTSASGPCCAGGVVLAEAPGETVESDLFDPTSWNDPSLGALVALDATGGSPVMSTIIFSNLRLMMGRSDGRSIPFFFNSSEAVNGRLADADLDTEVDLDTTELPDLTDLKLADDGGVDSPRLRRCR